MLINLNQHALNCKAELTLQQLLQQHQPDTHGIAVAINAQVIPRSQWLITRIQAGDDVQLFRIVTGG